MNKNISKKRNFAEDIVINGDTYAGIHAMPYVTAAVKSPVTIEKGYVRTIDGLTKSAVINNIASESPITAGSVCNFDSNDSVSTSEQILTLTDLKVNEQICRGTVFPTWMGQGMDRNGNLPQSFSDFILSTVAGKAGEQIETGIWGGNLAGTGSVGFLSNTGAIGGFANGAMKSFTTVETANADDPAGALAFLKEVYDKVARDKSPLMMKPGFGFYVGTTIYAQYLQALAGATTFQALGTAGNFDNVTFMGYPLYVCPGMLGRVVVATYPENLVFGTNLATDWTEARLIPTYQFDGSDNVRVTMNFALGVQTAVAGDGVIGYDLV
tara:strand:- start:1077 stop:2051 length:975 start_codon:yes stop_codon:yes gene_type:complete